jgi:hypothetical protein
MEPADEENDIGVSHERHALSPLVTVDDVDENHHHHGNRDTEQYGAFEFLQRIFHSHSPYAAQGLILSSRLEVPHPKI